MKYTLFVATAVAFFIGVVLGTTRWHEESSADPAAHLVHSSGTPNVEKSTAFARSTSVSLEPSALDLQRARMLRQAAVAFESSWTIQHAKNRQFRSQASELELRLFSVEFDEAEALFAAGHQIVADAFAKADVAEAGAGTISDAWLTQMQNRVEQLELKMRRLSARLL
ncbi:MAG: hypothetical protein WD872_06755 [Pirellulaceae bacterium]